MMLLCKVNVIWYFDAPSLNNCKQIGSLIILHVIVLLAVCSVSEESPVRRIDAVVGHPLVLPCTVSTTANSGWNFNQKPLYIGAFPVAQWIGNSMSIEEYSLRIKSVEPMHEGIYSCSENQIELIVYSVVTEVPPHLAISINGIFAAGFKAVFIELGEEATVTCSAREARPKVNLTWINLDEQHIEVVSSTVSIQTNVHTFDTVLMLQIIPLNASGKLTCSSTDQFKSPGETIEAHFETYALPNISIDDDTGTNNITIEVNTTLTALCSAYGARPPVKLSWFVNQHHSTELHNAYASNTKIYPSKEHGETLFDSKASLTYTPEDINGTLTCISIQNFTNFEQRVHRKYFTFLIPSITLSINGDVDRVVKVEKSTSFHLRCLVFGVRPAVTILWLLNGKPINSSLVQTNVSNHRSLQTFDYTSELQLFPDAKRGNITCVCHGLPLGNVLAHIVFQTFGVDLAEVDNSIIGDVSLRSLKIYLALSLCISLTVTSLLISSICICIRRTRGNINLLPLKMSTGLPQSTSTARRSTKTHDSSTDLSDSSQFQEECNKTISRKESVSKQPKLTLPEIPESVAVTKHFSDPEDEFAGHYYSSVKGNVSDERMLPRKDICFILNVNANGIYNRWMGTISTKGKKRCVLLTTMKDDIYEKDMFHWDEFVKRLLDVPMVKNITYMEGICINEGTLFSIHEHLTCETLETLLDPEHQQAGRESQFLDEIISNTNRSSYVKDVLEGMEFIQSFGFLHPGLTTKKVLVTAQKICKLYDFCLVKDAPDMLKIIKEKVNCQLQILPPEASQRNEYNRYSDVWSTAIVIWKIMFKNNLAECLQFLISRGYGMSVGTDKPESLNFIRCESMVPCFTQDIEQRPTISSLRTSLSQEMNQYDNYEIPHNCDMSKGLSDNYIPMKGIQSSTNRTVSLN